MHRCLVKGCDRMISDRLEICSFHWRDIPRELKRQIWDAKSIYAYEEALGDAVEYLDCRGVR